MGLLVALGMKTLSEWIHLGLGQALPRGSLHF